MKNEETRFIILGGLGEIGKNMYAIEHQDEIILIDAGISFAELTMLGIDYTIPDYSYLKENENKIKALFITHGHEDHIGAIPILIQSVNIKNIYAPNQAYELIKMKLSDSKREIELIECKTFYSRFKGFMFEKNIDKALLFDKCNSIHTFFMKCNIDIIMCDNNNIILFYYKNLPKNKIIWPKKGVRKVFETPSGYFDIGIGKKMIIK